MKQKKSRAFDSSRSTAAESIDHQAEHAKAIGCYNQGAHEDALAHVNVAIRAEPNMAIYQADAGFILLALGRNEEAVIPLKRAVQLDPNHADAHYNLGEAYQSLGQKDAAIDSFRMAVSLNRGLGWKEIKAALKRWVGFGP